MKLNFSSSSLLSLNKNDGRGDVGEDSGSWETDLVSHLFPLALEVSFTYLYILDKAFVAVVLASNDPSCRVYIGNDVKQDLSFGICYRERCDRYYYSSYGQRSGRASLISALTATLIPKDYCRGVFNSTADISHTSRA